MSYAQRKELAGNRGVAIFFTVVVVGSLLYAIITGLAYDVVKKAAENLKVIDVEQQPPPPEQPPPPPKDMPKVPPPPMTPPPLVQTNIPPPPTIQTVTALPPPVYIPPVVAAPPPPPPPPPPRKTQSAQPSHGDVRGAFSNDDYPASALAAGASGTAVARLSIGPDGRVTGCDLVQSTGNSSLDSTTCSILRRRVKFTPARDSNGSPTSDTYTTPPIKWVLPPE
jgi:periplasmic protein TonB